MQIVLVIIMPSRHERSDLQSCTENLMTILQTLEGRLQDGPGPTKAEARLPTEDT